MSNSIVVDSSAILAVVRKEKGFTSVVERLNGALVSTISMFEVISKSVSKGADADMAELILKQMPVRAIPFDMEQASIAARIKGVTLGSKISLADMACLALAISQDLPVLTGDPAWEELNLDVDIELFR